MDSALPAGWNQPTGLPQAHPLERMGHRGTYRGTQGSEMLRTQPLSFQEISCSWDTMTTRSAALITIALIAVLLSFVALAALFASDISERAGGIVSSVLGTFATVLAGLLLFLRVETLSTKADVAAEKAEVAAEKATAVETKVEQVHHDVLNGGLRQNVKRAIQEDRHDLRNKKAAERVRQQLERRGMPKRDEADQ